MHLLPAQKADLDEFVQKKVKVDKFPEINVVEQVRNICHVPTVKKGMGKGQPLAIHGFIYDIKDGAFTQYKISP